MNCGAAACSLSRANHCPARAGSRSMAVAVRQNSVNKSPRDISGVIVVSGPMKRFVDSNDPELPVIGLEDEYPPGYTDLSHSHGRAQLLYASSGVMSVIVDTASFVIPPQRGLWIPAGTAHEVSCRGHVSIRTIYFDDSEIGRTHV